MEPSRLQADADALGVRLDDQQAAQLIRYVALLERWNERFNLVSRRDIGRIWPRHVLDSLSIAPFIAELGADAARAVDIGTGAGLPGLPLAIALPSSSWTLLDRNQRKIRFLETVIGELGLGNVSARAVDLRGVADPGLAAVDLVVSRAVDEPAALLRLADPLLGDAGRVVLMTATAADAETEGEAVETSGTAADLGEFVVAAVREVRIPGLDRTHEVTIIERQAPRARPGSGGLH